MSDELKGDPVKIQAATDYLIDRFEEYAKENELSLADVFMCGHNVHKIMVKNVAKRWSLNKMAEVKSYTMADMTWRQAMRELKRG